MAPRRGVDDEATARVGYARTEYVASGVIRRPVAIAEAGAQSAQEKADALHAVAKARRAARQDVARELLRDISALVAELYGRIHPEDADDEVTGARCTRRLPTYRHTEIARWTLEDGPQLGEVRRFAEDARELVRALYCERCREFARAAPERGDVEVLRCGCEGIRHGGGETDSQSR